MADLIRLAGESDAGQVAEIYAPFVTHAATSFESVAPPPEETSDRIRKVLLTHPWLVADRDGLVLGFAYASQHRVRAAYCWSVDVAVYVRQDCRRTGVGRRLYAALFELLRLQGFVNAYAGIALPNAGSVGLHESMGFRSVGVYEKVGFKLGAWHDVGWWQLALRDYPDAPLKPLSMLEVSTLPEWGSVFKAANR